MVKWKLFDMYGDCWATGECDTLDEVCAHASVPCRGRLELTVGGSTLVIHTSEYIGPYIPDESQSARRWTLTGGGDE